jgi:hypothetical protein
MICPVDHVRVLNAKRYYTWAALGAALLFWAVVIVPEINPF